MSFQIEKKTLPDIPVMYIHRDFTQENINQGGMFFGQAAGYVVAHGGTPAGAFMLYGEPVGDIMPVDCCIAVKGLLPESDMVKAKIVAGGEFLMAEMVHTGSYGKLHEAWMELMRRIDEQGYEGLSPMREIYLDEDMSTPEEQLTTLLLVPVVRKQP